MVRVESSAEPWQTRSVVLLVEGDDREGWLLGMGKTPQKLKHVSGLWSQAIQDRMVGLIQTGSSIADAALLSGISTNTARLWIRFGNEENPDEWAKGFAEAVATAEALRRAALRQVLTRAATGVRAKDGSVVSPADPKWAAWLLEREDRSRYGDPNKAQQTDNGAGVVFQITFPGAPQASLDVDGEEIQDAELVVDGDEAPPPALAPGPEGSVRQQG